MKLVEGQLIHSRYRLDHRLAQGGMGEVWKGYDIQLNKVVAIKALRGDVKDVEAKLRRLRMEAHNSANLAHPNIAALFDYYEHDGIGFLIMEYVPSDSLADLYRKEGAMNPLELLPILVQVARGLYVAHSHGVIHRDVKPANIMVSEDGEVKITDFGVSYSTNQAQITQDGMVVGTAQYISPEQAQGKQATPQSDIYSLGVVAYEGLCGHRPFTGATPVDIAAAHVNDAVPPLPDTVDVQLNQFVMSMLAKDPRDRPKDALVVSRTLSRIERRLMDQQAALSDTTMVSRDGRIARRVVSAPYTLDGAVTGGSSSSMGTISPENVGALMSSKDAGTEASSPSSTSAEAEAGDAPRGVRSENDGGEPGNDMAHDFADEHDENPETPSAKAVDIPSYEASAAEDSKDDGSSRPSRLDGSQSPATEPAPVSSAFVTSDNVNGADIFGDSDVDSADDTASSSDGNTSKTDNKPANSGVVTPKHAKYASGANDFETPMHKANDEPKTATESSESPYTPAAKAAMRTLSETLKDIQDINLTPTTDASTPPGADSGEDVSDAISDSPTATASSDKSATESANGQSATDNPSNEPTPMTGETPDHKTSEENQEEQQ